MTAKPQQSTKAPNYMNYGYNEITGKVVFGEGCIINSTCTILCDSNDPQAKIVFGDYNIIEEKALIVWKPTEGNKVMNIGNYNIFGIRSFVTNTHVGNCNIFEPKCEVRDSRIGDCNMVGSKVRLARNNIDHDKRIFYPSKVKVIDVFDQERHKETIKALFNLSMGKPSAT